MLNISKWLIKYKNREIPPDFYEQPIGANTAERILQLCGIRNNYNVSDVRIFDFGCGSGRYMKLFAMSFVFRPLLKVVALGSCAILGAVLLLYGLKALACIARVLVGKD